MSEQVDVILRLRGSREFVSQATAATGSVEKIGKETEQAGKKAHTPSNNTGKYGKVLRNICLAASAGKCLDLVGGDRYF